MSAAETVANIQSGTVVPLLPASERQARHLSGLTPQLQREVWPIVVDTAPNGKVTAAHVQSTVNQMYGNDTRPLFDDAQLDEALEDETKPICPECGQVYDGEHCPDCPPEKSYNYLRDNRRSQISDITAPLGMDACQTPGYALDPLLPYLNKSLTLWEPARGEGLIVKALSDNGFSVVGSDILTDQNFFDYEPEQWDCLVTNPPYSVHFQWLKRCYELGKPFALLVKVELLGTKTAQELMQQYGFEILLLDKRVNFKMPFKGWESSAQFPTFWLCWKLLPEPVMFGKITRASNETD
jgi:hypothetical protein